MQVRVLGELEANLANLGLIGATAWLLAIFHGIEGGVCPFLFRGGEIS